MATTTTATQQTTFDCRWSRPGYRVSGVEDHLQPESFWVCVRTDERIGVSEAVCEHCPHWEDLPDRPQHPKH